MAKAVTRAGGSRKTAQAEPTPQAAKASKGLKKAAIEKKDKISSTLSKTSSKTKPLLNDVKKTTVSAQVSEKPVLVVLPGASGSLSKPVVEHLIPLLANKFDIRIKTGRWNVSKPSASSNIASVLELCPDNSESRWYILGNSFGNRVCCTMQINGSFPVPPSKLILCGYPMFSEKGTDERIKLLQMVPADTNMLCISGERDVFLSKGPAGRSQSAKLVYETVMSQMACQATTSLRILSGGGHSVVDVPSKAGQPAAADTVHSWISEFVFGEALLI